METEAEAEADGHLPSTNRSLKGAVYLINLIVAYHLFKTCRNRSDLFCPTIR